MYQLPSYRASGRLGRFRVAEVGQEKLLFNFFLDSPKPLFRAVCSLSPVLNLSHHFMRSVFGCSELHGKLMCKNSWRDRSLLSQGRPPFEFERRWLPPPHLLAGLYSALFLWARI